MAAGLPFGPSEPLLSTLVALGSNGQPGHARPKNSKPKNSNSRAEKIWSPDMPVIVTNIPAGSSDPQLPGAITPRSGRRRTTTLLRMALAFFFPWPFGTDGLKAAVATRARRMRPASARRAGKS